MRSILGGMDYTIANVSSSAQPMAGTMSRGRDLRPFFLAAAILLAAATVIYSAAWMYYIRRPFPVEIGFDPNYTGAAIEVIDVYQDSPAERVGLRPGDHIVAINGQGVASRSPYSNVQLRIWQKSRPGQTVVLTVERAGQPQPLVLEPVFRAERGDGDVAPLAKRVAQQIVDSFPVLFVVVGLTVLFLRVEDRNAWLLALVFSTFVCEPPMPDGFGGAPTGLRISLLLFRTICKSLFPALFYFFFAVFPIRSPIDRKAPWLKWLLLVLGAYLGLGGFRQGSQLPLPPLSMYMDPKAIQIANETLGYGTVLLGVASLVWSFLSVSDPEDRRKLKVIFWGTVVGMTPIILEKAAEDILGFRPSLWLSVAVVILVFLFPLSFAYAVVKHRVLDIPVLLRRSARYFIVERGFTILIFVISVGATLGLAEAFSAHFSAGSKAAIPVGATFGILLISGATQVHRRVRTRLDRAFFRSSYDAQQILENLAAKTLTVNSREDLAELLHDEIQDALHPQAIFIYLRSEDGSLHAYAGHPPQEALTLSNVEPGIAGLLDSAGPVEVNPQLSHGTQLDALRAECWVPIRGSSDGRLQGAGVLGPRLSEEPYSTGDKRLLASVASQAGIAMRSISMAEKMAERMEVERRSEQEMQIARQVQSRLLPQQAPMLPTLECAGQCIQTRAVGGDYYDFLDFGSGRLGLVLADIAGKGISAALLMANLQANLRGQYALALEDLSGLLRSVNRLFYKNTESNHYATMFFAVYDDNNRVLRYVNCGHNAPILLRANGDVERLEATATVLGLFEEWDCAVAEQQLSAGDVLVIYTDGISEAAQGDDAEEFGDDRLIANIKTHQGKPADRILDDIIAEVQRFSHGEQADDMTLIVSRCR
jgi:sigma-B regulation protein RsbU (phosphoserine phosphatase)